MEDFLTGKKHVHFIGIGGSGMYPLAQILHSKGFYLTGSDNNETETLKAVRKMGIPVYMGQRAENIEGADLIVYTAAIMSDNPELIAAKASGVKTIERCELLGLVTSWYNKAVCVSGTHGKTTTTSMVSLILKEAQKEPTILVGGNLAEIDGNVYIGDNEYFVTEACEYMDSFLNLKPKIEIILNIDSDHLDYFKDVEHIASSFDKFAKLVPSDGAVIAYDANPFVKSVIEGLPNAVTFGLGESCDYFASDIDFDNEGMPRFTVNHGGKELCRIALSVPGEHNVLNALSAFACGHILGVDVDSMVRTLENFNGIQRRFDVLGKTANNIKIIDDYAHHPTEIKATLSAVKKMKHNHMWCLFQPHTYTRTMALLDDFATSFTDADKVVLAEIYAAREKNIYKISSKSLMNRIKEEDPAKDVYFFSDFEEIANFVYNNAEPGDLVITMGAGDIYKVGEMILEKDKRF